MLLHGFDPIEHTVTGWCSKGNPWIDVAMALHFQHCHSLSNHVWSVDDFRLLHLLGNGFCRPLQLDMDELEYLLHLGGQISSEECANEAIAGY